jgi:hypothetical protein
MDMINKSIKSMSAITGKVDPKVHETLYQCLLHSYSNGSKDLRLVSRGYNAIKSPSIQQAVSKWIRHFFPVKWDEKGQQWKSDPESKKEWDLDGAFAFPHTRLLEHKKLYGPQKTVLDVAKIIQSGLRSTEKKLEKAMAVGKGDYTLKEGELPIEVRVPGHVEAGESLAGLVNLFNNVVVKDVLGIPNWEDYYSAYSEDMTAELGEEVKAPFSKYDKNATLYDFVDALANTLGRERLIEMLSTPHVEAEVA